MKSPRPIAVVGELLLRSGAKDAGAEKLRKALKIYRQFSAAEPNPAVAETHPPARQ